MGFILDEEGRLNIDVRKDHPEPEEHYAALEALQKEIYQAVDKSIQEKELENNIVVPSDAEVRNFLPKTHPDYRAPWKSHMEAYLATLLENDGWLKRAKNANEKELFPPLEQKETKKGMRKVTTQTSVHKFDNTGRQVAEKYRKSA